MILTQEVAVIPANQRESRSQAPVLADRLEKVLLTMHENDQGRQILKKTDDTTEFDRLP